MMEKPKATTKIKSASRFFKANMVVSPGISDMDKIMRPDFMRDLETKLNDAYLNSKLSNTLMRSFFKNVKNLLSQILSRKRNQALVFGTMALVLILGISSIFIFPNFLGVRQKPEEHVLISASLTYYDGNIEFKTAESGWYDAKADADLYEGYSVRVLGEGRAIITLDGGSVVRLDSDSSVTLKSMNPEGIFISNNKGEIYTRVAEANHNFTMKVGDAQVQAKGTAFKTSCHKNEKIVEVYHSQVEILGIDENDEILVKQGERYYFVYKADPGAEMTAQEITLDEIKADEFVLWNKEQDELIAEFKENMGLLFDLEPPALNVTSPSNGAKTEASSIAVTGTAEVGVKVYINGTEITNIEGAFSYSLSLNEGTNSIKVEAVDEAGNKTAANLTVTRTTPVVTPSYKITLYGTRVDSGISLSWNISGLDVSNGFKVVKSSSINPVYPGNDAVYQNSSVRKYIWTVTDGMTYYFRVCQYLGNGKCGVYSNNVRITAPKKYTPASSVTKIILSGSGAFVSWDVSGTSDNGFKVTWSKNPGPIYPTRTGDKAVWVSSSTRAYTIDAFDGTGKYYVIVYEYLGSGNVGTYSNQISVNL